MTAANDNSPTEKVAAEGTKHSCPICGKPATAAMRPFCSKRCADVDLHRWLGGRYAIPAEPVSEDDRSGDGD